jgi:tRNA pseudouridine65 synthase
MSRLRDQIGQWVYPIHRLDRPVSGILLFALNPETARRMGTAFQARDTRKTYLALVRGYCEDEGIIDYPLKEELDQATDARAYADPPAKPAVTEYTRLSKIEIPEAVGRYSSARYSLLALHPVTGRKHQLRRHMKHIFHPIVGDTTHGDGCHNRFFRDRFASNTLMLAATGLEFPHPHTRERLLIKTQPDAAFLNTLAKIGLTASTQTP